MERLRQMSRRTKVMLLGLAVLPILCCCGIFAISDVDTSGGEPTAEGGDDGIPAEAIQPTQEEATEAPRATSTARPTNTAEPTDTPRPATNTPRPTNTAVPPTDTAIPPTNTRPPATATSPPLPTNTAVPQPLPTQEPPAAVCDCSSGDTLNCGNFNTHSSAQACYDYCWAQTGQDIHGLDGNVGDGLACESLP
jgi:hypothetical protein